MTIELCNPCNPPGGGLFLAVSYFTIPCSLYLFDYGCGNNQIIDEAMFFFKVVDQVLGKESADEFLILNINIRALLILKILFGYLRRL